DFQLLDRSALLDLEPAIPEHYQCGVYLADHASIRNPVRYVRAIAHAYAQRGGRYLQAQVTGLEQAQQSWTLATSAGSVHAGSVVMAAGVWSRQLLKPLGIHLSLETQRGY